MLYWVDLKTCPRCSSTWGAADTRHQDRCYTCYTCFWCYTCYWCFWWCLNSLKTRDAATHNVHVLLPRLLTLTFGNLRTDGQAEHLLNICRTSAEHLQNICRTSASASKLDKLVTVLEQSWCFLTKDKSTKVMTLQQKPDFKTQSHNFLYTRITILQWKQKVEIFFPRSLWFCKIYDFNDTKL